MNLKDKTFVIYGASSGIGNALATELSKNNRVGTFSRRPLPESLTNGLHFVGDITNLSDVNTATQMFKNKWGSIDGFIYSVGLSQVTRFEAFKASDVKSVMETNFFGFTHVLESWLPEFLTRKSGLIAMVSGLMVHRSLPQGAAYFSTKAAQHVFFEGLRLDLESSGISFCEIRPGLVDTPMSRLVGIDSEKAWSPEKAAQYIIEKLSKGEKEIAFSKTMAILSKSVTMMPDAAYFKMIKGSVDRAFRTKKN